MEAILIFDLDEEKKSFDLANSGRDFGCAWYELVEFLRYEIKYQEHPPEIEEVYCRVRDKLAELKTDYNLPDIE